MDDEYEPGRWYRVEDDDGRLWCETSDRDEAIRLAKPGYPLYREYVKVFRRWALEDVITEEMIEEKKLHD